MIEQNADYSTILAEYKGDHGIRPHSLKVTTISTLIEEIAKGNANFPHLAIRGNYRAVTAHAMEQAYSRNLAQQKIVFSKLSQKAFEENQTAASLTTDLPEFSEKTQGVVNLYTPKL